MPGTAHRAAKKLMPYGAHLTTGINTILQGNPTKPKKKDEALDDTKSARPGELLIDALFQCASKQNLSLMDLAAKLGVTHGYRGGARKGWNSTTTS